MKGRICAVLATVIAVAAFVSCELAPFALSIRYVDEEVYIYEEEPGSSGSMIEPASRAPGGRQRIEDFQYRFYRVAQVVPVEVDGVETQANDLLYDGDYLYAVYNTAGAEFAGALQVINTSNPMRPRVIAEIGLPDADVNAIAIAGDAIYIAGAWDPDAATFPEFDPVENDRAFVVRIETDEITTITADDITDRKVIVPSYAATGVAAEDGVVYVSTGALDGEIAILDSNLNLVTLAALAERSDFRDIEIYHRGAIALQGTDQSGLTDGRVVTVGEDGSEQDTLVITDFGSPEAKATIEVYDRRYGFLALSEAGFQIVYLRDEGVPGDPVESLYTIANPSVEWSERTDTNSASYNDDLIFTANGEAGFRVFLVTGELRRDTPPGEGFTTLVGFIPFDETGPDENGNFWSANHVEYQEIRGRRQNSVGYLAVASGTGGVNLYYLTTR
jgi:hypothetical protein